MLEAQSSFVNELAESTKKIVKEMPIVQETIAQTQKIYSDSAEAVKNLANEVGSQFEKSTKEMEQNSKETQNYFQQWFENQMNMAKNVFENSTKNASNPFNFEANNQEWFKNWTNSFNQANSYWENMMKNNPYSSWMNNNPFGTWAQNNPFWNTNNMQSKFNEGMNYWSNAAKQYFDMMNNSYSDWTKNFVDPTAAESFKGMNNMANTLSSFFEMWMPMMKNIQDKTFNKEVFNQFMNPEKYKAFMDQFFSFMPDSAKQYMDQMNQQFVASMKQMTNPMMNQYNAFKAQYNNTPWANMNPFAKMWENYSQMNSAFANAAAPFGKLMADNSNYQAFNVWNDIYNRMVEFNMKNNELQYMMYMHGVKVMDKTADNLIQKIQNGETIDSIIKVYQDWMMTGDEIFSKMFESDEYSKLMTEVSSLQLKLKMDIEKQMEKTILANIPVATRTEMDEVYQNIYNLKKMYRNLEKMFAAQNETPKSESDNTTANKETTATKTAASASSRAKKK
ncbi:MAG: hypothetical protein H6607_06690 [Flavobacteriales bacterium]|nr:hypothetical protein [Flavobacteriales bacterium]